MAVYKVVEIGDPVLKEIAKPIKEITPNVIKLLENMADTMYAYDGVGLAAPQIGVSKRAIVVDVGEGLIELINPEIVAFSGEEKDVEGCLSIPGVQGEVVRSQKVTVKGLNRHGEEIIISAEGLLARAFQHEIDHLNGILFVEKADNIIRKGR
ncbi:peptide deformylase [Carboxydothermus pertinax]|uniref:Peptide deformylase n=1 Tax=Carboxydothermus pertinax TaxID=870242 RepID=A0A1L8CXR2_9THEO|nr:peptide deformylase [Carboxydothermus pertinax]GAV23726.1 peptide deformylase [Carboxydothermus pertinax]